MGGTLPIARAKPQPRTSQISTRPITADAMPAMRNDMSGLSKALAAKRLAAAGKPAKTRPSMTRTRPMATMNSDMGLFTDFGAVAEARSLFRRSLRDLALRIAEIAE